MRRPPLACDRSWLVVLSLCRPGVVAAAGAGGGPVDGVCGSGPADGGAAEVAVPAVPAGPGVGAAPPGESSPAAGTDAGTGTGRSDGDAGSAGPAGAGTGVDPTPGSARVEIAAGGHQVVVEAPESLDRVAAKAMEVWAATDPADLVRGFGFGGGTGDPVVVDTPLEVELPRRMAYTTPDTDD